jgi:hypothetical protein
MDAANMSAALLLFTLWWNKLRNHAQQPTSHHCCTRGSSYKKMHYKQTSLVWQMVDVGLCLTCVSLTL